MMLSRKGLIKECNFVNFFHKFLNLLALPPVTTTEPDGNSQKLQTLVVVDKDAVVSWDSLRAVSCFYCCFFFIIFPELIKNEFLLTMSVHFPTGR